MEFKKSDPVEGMPCRWTSENNVWEIGMRPMMFGVRVSAGKIHPDYGHAMSYSIDYCAGGDEGFVLILFAVVAQLLSRLPESIAPNEVEKLFPGYEMKPINKDPHCWDELLRLSNTDNPFQDCRQ